MKPTIKVTIEMPFGQPITVCRQVSDHTMDEALRRVDLATDDADPFTRMFICTNPVDVRRVFTMRQDIAKTVAKEIAAALVEIMERQDTCMGYTKEENEKYHGYPKWPKTELLK